jgi:AraC-like DNA-binding protein
MPKKISHLKDEGEFKKDKKKRNSFSLPDNGGRIFSYHPFKSMQIIFFDIHSSEFPDLWGLGYRKGDDGRYLRTLICRRGSCEFTVNGKTNTLTAGHVMLDYGVGDDCQFSFTSEDFVGVEITMQVDTLVKESTMLRMLRLVIESMYLPEEEIFDSDGYIFKYFKSTEQTLDKLLSAGFDGDDGVIIVALIVEIGHSLGTDLKKQTEDNKITENQRIIADDIYNCLTEDFGTKYTAAQFAEKYGISDTTVKKYFKTIYGYGFKEYQTKVRMGWAAQELIKTDKRISEISEATCYSKQTKFTKAFKNYYGATPSEYRAENK